MIRGLHAILAVAILLQSVATLSLPYVFPVDSTAIGSAELQLSSTEAVVDKADLPPCHSDKASENPRTTENCCDSMDSAECVLVCAGTAAAIPGSVALDSRIMHPPHPRAVVYASPQKASEGLYRPPRLTS